MNDVLTISIIGVYTAIYLVVFIIQKAQINSIKSFMEIFDIDEVKKYVELKEESAHLAAAKLLLEDEKMQSIVNKSVKKIMGSIVDSYDDDLKETFNELGAFVAQLIYELPEKESERILNSEFPHSKQYIKQIIIEAEKELENQ